MFLVVAKEPQTINKALSSPEWLAAMQEEINTLHQNKTWTLVPKAPSMNIVGSRWVFKTKLKDDGSIDRYKSKLVAKGYSELEGVDFEETFSRVVKVTIIRVVLSVAGSRHWSIVGSLQYLTLTRPDIAHAVNLASQFMQSPNNTHYQDVKRILRYVKGTTKYGLSILSQSPFRLYGFSDAD
nr:uncharacterized mitochondrial protein AtMg00820-like [Nicotiana tomentosiformis]